MSIVDRLQAIVRERGTNFKQLEREIGLGNGTIRRWEEQSPRLDKLTKVADFLQVSLDYLVYGRNSPEAQTADQPIRHLETLKQKEQLTCDGSPLSDEEADLVAMYRFLPSHKREDAFDIVYVLYRKHVEMKKESIYWTYKEDSEGGPAEGHGSRSATA